MGTRQQLNAELITVLGSDNVYYQPPEAIKIKYPCIVYELDKEWVIYSNGLRYADRKRYSVTIIDSNPDSEIPERLSKLPMVSFNRFFKSDNLCHFVYSIYY